MALSDPTDKHTETYILSFTTHKAPNCYDKAIAKLILDSSDYQSEIKDIPSHAPQ